MATKQILKPFRGEFLGQRTEGNVELIKAQVTERVGGYLKTREMTNEEVLEVALSIALDSECLSGALWKIECFVRELHEIIEKGAPADGLVARLGWLPTETCEFNLEVELFLNSISRLLNE